MRKITLCLVLLISLNAFANWIQNFQPTPAQTSAKITFTSATSAECWVRYGTSTAYGQATARDSSFSNSHTAYISNLTAATVYDYAATCLDQKGRAATSPNHTFSTLASTVAHSVPLNWTDSVSIGVTSQNVYRSTISGGYYALLASLGTSATAYTDSSVNAGQTYYYVVTDLASGR